MASTTILSSFSRHWQSMFSVGIPHLSFLSVFNVTLLEPKKKHPSIFARFDALKAGESFTILNDHDPKPLYYQIEAESNEPFKWEYLIAGPDDWKVKVGKTTNSKQ